MRRLLSIILSLLGVMAFAQQPVGQTSDCSDRSCNSVLLCSPALSCDPVLKIATSYLGTPYVANTLENDGEESLLINLKEVDCLTLVEYTLAQALCSSSGSLEKESSNSLIKDSSPVDSSSDVSLFAHNLQKIRYRNGIIDGYPSRLHYTSDWIDNGIRQGFLQDVTAEHSPNTLTLSLSYMSTHPQLYKKLADSPENVARMAEQEKAITGKVVHWLPKSKLPEAGLPWIMDGDIIAITTKLPGLDIAHMGIAKHVDGNLHLLHASSILGKVVVSDEPLNHLLNNKKSWTGIRVIRMSPQKQ